MAKRSDLVRRATAALAGYSVKYMTRRKDDMYTGWWFTTGGGWVGAYKTLGECLDDIFNFHLEA